MKIRNLKASFEIPGTYFQGSAHFNLPKVV
jgi:hypothetical protein